jgi:predicted PurR-regulated permease PerM
MKLRKADPALIRLLFFVICFLAVAAVLVFAGRILLPLIMGLVVAYLLDPAVSWFERKGRSRAFGTVVISLAVLLAIAIFLLVVVPVIGEQAAQLRHRLPTYERQVQERVLPWLDRVRDTYPEQFDQVRAKAEEIIREKWPVMLRSTMNWLGGVFSSVLGFFLFLLDLVFVPVFAFYLLVDFSKLKQGIRGMIPLPYREVTLARLGEVDDAVSSFVRGQLTIALILAAINGIGLTVLGVPLGLLLGIVAGLANMIPYMALVVGLAPAMLLCWIEFQSLPRLIGVVAVFGLAQLLEGTILSPRILSKSVHLHPVWVLLAIIVGGRLFGLLGMVAAVPAAAAIHVFVRHWLESYRGSAFYRGAAASGGGSGGEAGG